MRTWTSSRAHERRTRPTRLESSTLMASANVPSDDAAMSAGGAVSTPTAAESVLAQFNSSLATCEKLVPIIGELSSVVCLCCNALSVLGQIAGANFSAPTLPQPCARSNRDPCAANNVSALRRTVPQECHCVCVQGVACIALPSRDSPGARVRGKAFRLCGLPRRYAGHCHCSCIHRRYFTMAL